MCSAVWRAGFKGYADKVLNVAAGHHTSFAVNQVGGSLEAGSW